jgi:hypothetical protein
MRIRPHVENAFARYRQRLSNDSNGAFIRLGALQKLKSKGMTMDLCTPVSVVCGFHKKGALPVRVPFRTTICGIDQLGDHCTLGVTHVLSILDPRRRAAHATFHL